jgi:hypothetical protein
MRKGRVNVMPSASSTKPAGSPKKRGPGLGRTALDYLVANAPTPEVFEEVPDHPPFDLQAK